MKSILLSLALLSSAAFADYDIIKNKSESFQDSQIKTQEVIYFGSLSDYSSELLEIQKSISIHGINGALQGASAGSEALAKGLASGMQSVGAGLGIGLVIGALDPFVMELYADQKYIQVSKVTLNDEKTVYTNSFFIGNKNPSYSNEEIKSYINK